VFVALNDITSTEPAFQINPFDDVAMDGLDDASTKFGVDVDILKLLATAMEGTKFAVTGADEVPMVSWRFAKPVPVYAVFDEPTFSHPTSTDVTYWSFPELLEIDVVVPVGTERFIVMAGSVAPW
jgi:hypothetical protein